VVENLSARQAIGRKKKRRFTALRIVAKGVAPPMSSPFVLHVQSPAVARKSAACLIGPLLAIPLCLWSLGHSNVSAQSWAADLFPQRHHDFGTVSRGAKAVHLFEIHNTTDSEIRITSARSSCGCLRAQVVTPTIAAGQTGSIAVELNSQSFVGQRSAAVTVVFQRPYFAEVQLTAGGLIRSDIVTEPGQVEFGEVELGQGKEATIRIKFAGRESWRITDVRSHCAWLEAQLQGRRLGDSRIEYLLTVRLKDSAPAGPLQESLVVYTNDPQNDHFTLPVQGRIQPPISLAPEQLFLGDVQLGQPVQQRMVVRGKQAFSITALEVSSPTLRAGRPEGQKPLHIIPIEFVPQELGPFRHQVSLQAAGESSVSLTCEVIGNVVR